MKQKGYLWTAIATMIGTIIGAGILGIPYVVAKAGFWTGVFDILFLGIVSLFLYLYFGEVVLRTEGNHQLPGYAEKYLGKKGKTIMMFAMIFGIYGALTAYLLGVSQAITAVIGGSATQYLLIFFAIAGFIIYLGLKEVAESESYMQPLVLIAVVVLAVLSFKYISFQNLSGFSLKNVFVPYGVVLFAFLGATAIPEMQMELKGREKLMKKAILIGILIPIVVYLGFAAFIVGVTGTSTTEVATIGLGKIVGEHIIIIGNIFAVLTMSTSFLILGLALKDMYRLDYNINKDLAWALTCAIPLIIAIANLATFTKVLEIAGIISGGITGVVIVLMAMKAKTLGTRKPEYTVPINWMICFWFMLLFTIGVVYYLYQIL